VLALAEAFNRPDIDWAAISPELILLGAGAILTLVDATYLERGRRFAAALGGLALLAPLVAIIALAADDQAVRETFGGAYVVDDFALIMKAMFLIVGYIVVLLSTNYIAEGDYWESEYYSLLITSVLGMVVMASARDLVTIFVALELLSIPAYMLATWRKRDLRSNEAGMKYYLMGVFASAVMLYGMSLLYGATGSTRLAAINEGISGGDSPPSIVILGGIFLIVGFAFKVSAFPFHTWAPDTYEGAPTPVTAFLSVASKAAGFVALILVVLVGFHGRSDVYEPLMWILAAASMTAGNLMALRQTNLVRMMAYSGVAQAGFMLAPLAVAGGIVERNGVEVILGNSAAQAMVTYMIIYAAMNLGVFAVIIAVARKTGSAEISSYAGLFSYAPGLFVAMSIFMLSLAGIPPLGGWFAKFEVFRTLLEADTRAGVVLAVIAAVNAVIALYYYLAVLRGMIADEAPDGDVSPVHIPASLKAALVITAVAVIAVTPFLGPITEAIDQVQLVAGS
jgi:NADH-quinone oxidoreductase subunit N